MLFHLKILTCASILVLGSSFSSFAHDAPNHTHPEIELAHQGVDHSRLDVQITQEVVSDTVLLKADTATDEDSSNPELTAR